MNTFEQYLYKDTKTIHYPNYIKGHKAINLIRDKNNITININEVTIKLPKESFNKILENEDGVITINKQEFKLKKLKTSDHIDVIIRDENGNIEESKIKVVHFNVPDWHQFKCFMKGYDPIMVLSLTKENTYGTNEIRDEIGIGIYPYNFNSKDLKHIMNIKGTYMELVDHYTSEFDLNKNLNYKEKNIDYLKSKIELYLEKCERPLIVQNLDKIEEILNIKLPKDRIYNIDEQISFEDYKDTINHQYTIKEKKLFIAGGSPHQNALTLSQLYFDKEILKNVDNQLDKIIQINQEIKGLEPIFDFNI